MRKLPLGAMIFYGFGQSAEGIKTAVFNTFVLFYYNQIIGIPGTVTGAVLLCALLVDAVTDPLAGYLSDKTRTRWGRRHPFMLASALPLGLALMMLFNPPAEMSTAFYAGWLLAFSIFVRLSLTLFHVPHLALGAEMSKGYVERSWLYGLATLFGAYGGYGFAFLAYAVFFPTAADGSHGLYVEAGYMPFSLAAGGGVIFAILVTCWGTAKEIPFLSEPVVRNLSGPVAVFKDLFREMGQVFANPSYRSIFLGLLLGTLVVAMEAIMTTYVSVHFWGFSSEQIRNVLLAVVVGLPVGFVLGPILTYWLDKKWTLLGTAGASILIANSLVCLRLFTDVLPENGDPLIFQLVFCQVFLTTVIAPAVAMTVSSMFADIADEQQYRVGVRQEGVIFAARSFSLKTAAAVGQAFAGISLDVIGFPTQAAPGTVDPDVIWRLGLVAGPLTSLFTFFGLLLYLGYQLDKHKMAHIRSELQARSEAPV